MNNSTDNDENINSEDNINEKELILTLKVSINNNNINDIIVPDNIKIDNIIKKSRDNLANEIENLKKKEINLLKEKIKENNEKKLNNFFKKIINNYNSEFEKNINDNNINNNSESDPFLLNYHLIENKNESVENKSSELIVSTENKNNNFNSFFNMIYIINLPNERKKINNLTKFLEKRNCKYRIIDGIRPKNNKLYLKLYKRWLFQRELNYEIMEKFVFDEKIYIRKNKDLENKLTNKTKAWGHWRKKGLSENRKLYEKTQIKNVNQLGNLIAHMNVIKDAQKNKYNRILILEDDIYHHNNFDNLFIKYVENINKFDILYLGGIQKKWDSIKIESNYYNSKNTYGGFAYGINRSMYTKMILLMEELVLPLDKCLIQVQKYSNKCYVTYPNLFITDLENGKIHRNRDIKKYSKYFKWQLDDYILK